MSGGSSRDNFSAPDSMFFREEEERRELLCAIHSSSTCEAMLSNQDYIPFHRSHERQDFPNSISFADDAMFVFDPSQEAHPPFPFFTVPFCVNHTPNVGVFHPPIAGMERDNDQALEDLCRLLNCDPQLISSVRPDNHECSSSQPQPIASICNIMEIIENKGIIKKCSSTVSVQNSCDSDQVAKKSKLSVRTPLSVTFQIATSGGGCVSIACELPPVDFRRGFIDQIAELTNNSNPAGLKNLMMKHCLPTVVGLRVENGSTVVEHHGIDALVENWCAYQRAIPDGVVTFEETQITLFPGNKSMMRAKYLFTGTLVLDVPNDEGIVTVEPKKPALAKKKSGKTSKKKAKRCPSSVALTPVPPMLQQRVPLRHCSSIIYHLNEDSKIYRVENIMS